MTEESGESTNNKTDYYDHAVQQSSTWIRLFSEPEKESHTIKFICCFRNCQETFAAYEELEAHLCFRHFADVQEYEEFGLCGIRGCDMLLSDAATYKRHLIFHCYQAKLQHKGAELALKTIQSQDVTIDCGVTVFEKANNVFYAGDVLMCFWDGCQQVFDDMGVFFGHVYSHTDDTYDMASIATKKLACRWLNCTSAFVNKIQLVKHLKHHTGEKFISCPFCGCFFSNNTKFLDHIHRQTTPDSSKWQCFLCNKIFPTQRLLREHSRRHINTQKCPYCDMSCVGPHNMRMHIADRHSEEKSNICSICSSAFSRKSDMHKHMMRHTTDVTFQCEECDAKFSWKNALLTHKKSHEKPTYACHICSKVYRLGSILSRHLVKHHKLGLPPGHCRFMYKKCADGLHRLQTERYESASLVARDDEQQAVEATPVTPLGLTIGE